MDFLSNLLGHISSLNQVASSVTNAIQQVGTEATAVQGALSGDKESALTIAEQGLDAIVYVYSLSGGSKADLIDYLEQGDDSDPDPITGSSNN
jgi:hypothetical protein